MSVDYRLTIEEVIDKNVCVSLCAGYVKILYYRWSMETIANTPATNHKRADRQ